MNYFDDDTFWVLLEVGNVRVLKVNGVGVGVGGPGAGVVCFFLLWYNFFAAAGSAEVRKFDHSGS